MKNNVKREKSNRKWLSVSIASLLLVLVIGGSVLWFQNDSADDQQVETPDITEAPAEVGATEQFVMETDGLKINTQYASMYYPDEYVNDVIINVNEDAEKSVVSVFAMFDGKNYELFSVIFDTSESEGFKMGSLKHEDKEVGIFVRMNEWNTDNWPDAEVMHLSRLQESVNILIDQLHNADGFVVP